MNSVSLTNNKFLPSFFYNRIRISIIGIIVFILFASFFLWIGIIKEQGVAVLIAIACLPFLFLFFRYPRFWLYTIALLSCIYFRSSGEGISLIDVVTGLFYLGTLLCWFTWQIFIKKEKLVENIADFIIISFYILLIINSFIGYLNGVNILNWIREFGLFSMLLFYFPIRNYFQEEKYLKRFLLAFALSILVVDIIQFYEYYTYTLPHLVYAYEALTSGRQNQPLYTAGAVSGIIFALYQKNIIKQISLIIFSAITTLALISTFSRTFWIILLAEVILIIFYFPFKQKLRLGIYSFLLIIFTTSSIYFVFKDNTKIITTVIEKRFTSSTEGKKDESIRTRLSEYGAVWQNIKRYPLGGSGLSKPYASYEAINMVTIHKDYVHNGYLFLFYVLGIPLAILFLIPHVYFILKSENIARKTPYTFHKYIALVGFTALILMIIAEISSPVILQRDGIFIYGLSFALISIAEKNKFKMLKDDNKNNKNSLK